MEMSLFCPFHLPTSGVSETLGDIFMFINIVCETSLTIILEMCSVSTNGGAQYYIMRDTWRYIHVYIRGKNI